MPAREKRRDSERAFTEGAGPWLRDAVGTVITGPGGTNG